ncbi:hypothetical protein P3S68_014977 [Capsicum galapagoense]
MVLSTDLTPSTHVDNSTISTNSIVDSSHPLYVHPSDSPAIVLVPVPFSGTGYMSWRRHVMIALCAKNKAGLVNGRISKPNLDSPLCDQWLRCNDMVFAWLSNSLSKDIAESVLQCETARDVCMTLKRDMVNPMLVDDNAQLTRQFSARWSSSINLPNFGVGVESTGNNVSGD